MKKLYIFSIFAYFLVSCSGGIVKTGAISEENRINLSSVSIGMQQYQVLDIMGYPYKTEQKTYEDKIYEVWFYQTEPTLLGQSQLITRNFTPLIFEEGSLIGWGMNFYKYTFDIDNERQKRKEEQRQKYTDDKDEWPRNEHAIIPPMPKPPKKEKVEAPDRKIETEKEEVIEEQKLNEEKENPTKIEETPSSDPQDKDDDRKELKENIDAIDKKPSKQEDQFKDYNFWE